MTTTIIRALFAPNGSVISISERPEWADPQQWFNFLSNNTVNCYQSLANGRGVFRIGPDELAVLKMQH